MTLAWVSTVESLLIVWPQNGIELKKVVNKIEPKRQLFPKYLDPEAFPAVITDAPGSAEMLKERWVPTS